MNKRKEYILIIGITLLSWGLFYPGYAFTADSYRMLPVEELGDSVWTSDNKEGAEEVAGNPEYGDDDGADSVQSAVRDGRVRYKLKLAEYLKNLFS